jgi:DNA mismatch endonuclease, patch repair protein
MAQVKGHDTQPEKAVRCVLHRMGYRFRLHRTDLPGKPDIVLPKHKKIVFVHGCFWHDHKGCKRSGRPSTNIKFWNQKLLGNAIRDRRVKSELRKRGWAVLVIWGCETRNDDRIERKLQIFLSS